MGRKETPVRETTWGDRLYFIIPGLLLIGLAIVAVSQGVWWIPGFSQKFGQPRITPALTFGGLGIVLLVIGLFPWNHLRKNQKTPRRGAQPVNHSAVHENFHDAGSLRKPNSRWCFGERKCPGDERPRVNFAGA